MIIVEDRLNIVLDKLNTIGGVKPTFRYGDEKELLAFLRSKSGSKKTPYPLIWLEYPYNEIHKKNYVTIDRMSLVIAVKTLPELLNDERLEKTYKKLLILIVDNIIDVFKKSNIVFVKDEVYEITKFPNYQDDGKHKSTDIWDAIKLTFELQISNNCSN